MDRFEAEARAYMDRQIAIMREHGQTTFDRFVYERGVKRCAAWARKVSG